VRSYCRKFRYKMSHGCREIAFFIWCGIFWATWYVHCACVWSVCVCVCVAWRLRRPSRAPAVPWRHRHWSTWSDRWQFCWDLMPTASCTAPRCPPRSASIRAGFSWNSLPEAYKLSMCRIRTKKRRMRVGHPRRRPQRRVRNGPSSQLCIHR